jgi:hypothetical protein
LFTEEDVVLRFMCLIALATSAGCASLGERPVGSTVQSEAPADPRVVDDRAHKFVPVGSTIDAKRPKGGVVLSK